MTAREDFLKEEIRNDFLVDADRKRLWKIELDILEEFDRICTKYSIDYFILGGALIGAVRHHGFIPWDDDIDIGMFRDDLNKFLKIAPSELKEKYYLQDGISEPDYFSTLIRIRDKDSTGICRRDVERKCNNGIFIELYPFDRIIKSRNNNQKFKVKILYHILFHSCYGTNTSLKSAFSLCISKFAVKIFGREKIYQRMNRIASKYNSVETEYVDEVVTSYSSKYKYSDLAETIYVDFEYLKIRIPKGYDNCLKTTYGNYMTLPPVEKRNHHNGVVYYNPYIPYTDECAMQLAKEYFKETPNKE